MDDDARLTIGALARRTGLSVRTIRFYADAGVVPAADRTEAGYRLFGPEAVARARLVRTLRELGIGLDAVREVLARERSVAEVAATHAAALDAQIRVLRLQRSVLRAVASSPDHEEDLDRMHDLATLTADERRRIITDFVDEAFAGLPADAPVREQLLAAAPELPDDPSPEQLDAWIELGTLVRDDGFRARVREMAVRGSAEREPPPDPALMEAVAAHAGQAAAAGTDPASQDGRAALERILAVAGEPEDRTGLAARIETFADPRVARYWALLGTVNGWPPGPDLTPAYSWYAAALRAHP
jgi:DNA-binding transcriptional MerR regulator